MNSIVFKEFRMGKFHMTRERIEPYCLGVKEFGVITARRNLHIITGGKLISSMQS
jgi:hypothetical protein